jgi:hypothetical protein
LFGGGEVLVADSFDACEDSFHLVSGVRVIDPEVLLVFEVALDFSLEAVGGLGNAVGDLALDGLGVADGFAVFFTEGGDALKGALGFLDGAAGLALHVQGAGDLFADGAALIVELGLDLAGVEDAELDFAALAGFGTFDGVEIRRGGGECDGCAGFEVELAGGKVPVVADDL